MISQITLYWKGETRGFCRAGDRMGICKDGLEKLFGVKFTGAPLAIKSFSRWSRKHENRRWQVLFYPVRRERWHVFVVTHEDRDDEDEPVEFLGMPVSTVRIASTLMELGLWGSEPTQAYLEFWQ